MKRAFTPELLKTWGLPYEALTPFDTRSTRTTLAVVHQDEAYDHSDKRIFHEIVFLAPDDGNLYEILYSDSLDDSEDDIQWDSLGIEVEPYEVTLTKYRRVLDEDHDHALV
jgi:hypothetical protein